VEVARQSVFRGHLAISLEGWLYPAPSKFSAQFGFHGASVARDFILSANAGVEWKSCMRFVIGLGAAPPSRMGECSSSTGMLEWSLHAAKVAI
jgi:hypothetical protein